MPPANLDLDYELVWKIVLVGDSGVGKTNFYQRYTENIFSVESKTTIGVDFSCKDVPVNGKKVRVQLWDTAGQEKFRAISSLYYRKAKAVMMLYDITDHQSFESITSSWLKEIEREFKDANEEQPVLILIGHKYDLRHVRVIPENQGRSLADKYKMMYSEASSLESTNVEETMKGLLNEVSKIEEERARLRELQKQLSIEEPIALHKDTKKQKKKRLLRMKSLKSCCTTS